MMTQHNGVQGKMDLVRIEELVPQDHLLRKVEALVDFSFIYDEVRDLYCPNNGRPSTDPVVVVKYLLLGFLYGIESERAIECDIADRNSFRWFLGLSLSDKTPDHSTISQLRKRKFNGTDLFRKIFERILALCIEQGLVDGKLILSDSTHVKANASKKSEVKIEVEKETLTYWDRLDKYEQIEREKLESEGKIPPVKRRKQAKAEPKTVTKTVSTTDPDAGRLNRPGKPEGMHYLDHQSIDVKNGIIVDAFATAGNVADCVPYLDRIEYIEDDLGLKIGAVAVDSGYDTTLIHRKLDERGIEMITPEKQTSDTSKTEFKRDDFSYYEERDEFICPGGNILKLQNLQRNESTVNRVYKASIKDCKDCPQREKCLAPSQKCRKIQVNIFEKIYKRHHKNDGSPAYKAALRARQIWSEGTFAAQKERHNLKRIFRRGIEAAQTHCLLSAIAVNLKRMVKYAARARNETKAAVCAVCSVDFRGVFAFLKRNPALSRIA
jgi:transposase